MRPKTAQPYDPVTRCQAGPIKFFGASYEHADLAGFVEGSCLAREQEGAREGQRGEGGIMTKTRSIISTSHRH